MSKSIKLNDNQFIDATGVYDSSLGKTQNNINKQVTTPLKRIGDTSQVDETRTYELNGNSYYFLVTTWSGGSVVNIYLLNTSKSGVLFIAGQNDLWTVSYATDTGVLTITNTSTTRYSAYHLMPLGNYYAE